MTSHKSERYQQAADQLHFQFLAVLGKSLVLLIAGLILLPPVSHASINDVGTPQLFWSNEDAGHEPALLSEAHLTVDIRGSVARGVLTQRFDNTGESWRSAIYVMPLPEGAAVHGWQLRVGDRRIQGRIREREVAQRQFAVAQAEGRRAGLVETVDPGLFRVRVANIDPMTAVAVEVEMTLPVDIIGRQFAFRFPTTLVPRYRMQTFAGEAGEASTDTFWRDLEQPLAQEPLGMGFLRPDADAHAYPFRWRVTINNANGIGRVATPLHLSGVSRQGSGDVVLTSLAPGGMDRDFLVVWELPDSSVPSASLSVERIGNHWYGALDVLEPIAPSRSLAPDRDLIVLLDVSGSMAGDAIRQALAASRVALEELTPRDRFNVIAFNHESRSLFSVPEHATPDAVLEGLAFLARLEAGGGTEIAAALEVGLAQLDRDVHSPQTLSQMIFVTDGAIANPAGLYRTIARDLGQARLSTVAIGPSPNSAFMRQSARLGRGLYRQVSRIQDAGPVLENLCQTLARPLLTDIEVDWSAPVTNAWPASPDLHQGEPLRLLVRFAQPPVDGRLFVTGNYAGRPFQIRVPVEILEPPVGAGGSIAALWASEYIGSLLDAAALRGAPAADVRPVALPLALEHAVVTPFTSLLAEELKPARAPEARAGTYRLPNPSVAQMYDFPQTATGIELWLYGGMSLLVLVAFIRVLRWDEPAP